jgi:hypothetical protein
VTTFRFKFEDGRTKEARGRDWRSALKALGYGPSAMLYVVVSFEELAASKPAGL